MNGGGRSVAAGAQACRGRRLRDRRTPGPWRACVLCAREVETDREVGNDFEENREGDTVARRKYDGPCARALSSLDRVVPVGPFTTSRLHCRAFLQNDLTRA